MSVASVLERSGNVRDVREVYLPDEFPVWDMISDKELIEHFPNNNWRHALFMGLDVYKFPAILEYCKNIKYIASRYSTQNGITFSDNNFRIENFIRNTALVRLLERNLSEDLNDKEELRDGFLNLREIVNTFENDRPKLNALDYTFYFKVCFPSKNVDFVVNSLLKNKERFIEDIVYSRVWFNAEHHSNNLRKLAILKLLKPSLFENINVKNSEIYKRCLKKVNDSLNTEEDIDPHVIDLAAYLKFFAAEKAVLGPHGIELTMPKSLALPSSPTLPEIGRFEG